MEREFVIMPEFDKKWREVGLNDEDLKDLQEYLCHHPQTIEAWEAGKCIPQGPAQRMLELMDKKPTIINDYITIK